MAGCCGSTARERRSAEDMPASRMRSRFQGIRWTRFLTSRSVALSYGELGFQKGFERFGQAAAARMVDAICGQSSQSGTVPLQTCLPRSLGRGSVRGQWLPEPISRLEIVPDASGQGSGGDAYRDRDAGVPAAGAEHRSDHGAAENSPDEFSCHRVSFLASSRHPGPRRDCQDQICGIPINTEQPTITDAVFLQKSRLVARNRR